VKVRFMTSALPNSQVAEHLRDLHSKSSSPVLDVVIPVYNEERGLESCIRRLVDYLRSPSFPYSFRVTIADNASIDNTLKVAFRLSDEFPEVEAKHLLATSQGLPSGSRTKT
jgi:cellulose synthase/poly-beta-1,6-N-acetylglucosamine synthase-like glycosyltransferase